jgi:hypothetical protein
MNIVTILKAQAIELSLYPKVIEKLYASYEHGKTRYEMVNNAEQLKIIKENNCYTSVQYQGVAYILFFCCLDINGSKRKMNILISKKELKKTAEQNKMNEIKMFNVYIPFVAEEYYTHGSILDGKMTKSSDQNKIGHCFLIHELYYRPYDDMDLLEKHQIIRKDFLPSFSGLKLDFKLCRIYDLEMLPEVLFEKLQHSKNKAIGLMFLFRKTRSYYVFSNEPDFDLVRRKLPLPNVKTYDNSTQEFVMRSSGNTDVYNLYDLTDNSDVGLACIPNIETSHYYKSLFKHQEIIKVKCIRSNKFDKWIPLTDDCYDHVLNSV